MRESKHTFLARIVIDDPACFPFLVCLCSLIHPGRFIVRRVVRFLGRALLQHPLSPRNTAGVGSAPRATANGITRDPFGSPSCGHPPPPPRRRPPLEEGNNIPRNGR